WGVELIPYIEVDVDGLGAFRLPLYTFDWELGTDSRPITSKVTVIEHLIPALDSDMALDLGEVVVGDVAEVEYDVDNGGGMALTGTALITGDAFFQILDRSFTTPADASRSLTVSFAPTEAGDF